jgi:hypothetical protein
VTQPFVIGIRILLCILFGFWGYRLWRGTASWTARSVGVFLSAVILLQIVVDAV